MKNFKLLILISIFFTSCGKEPIDRFRLKGVVLDEITQKPIKGISVSFDAIGPSGLFGTRRTAGSAKSDSKGNFECKLRVFESATEVEPSAYTYVNDNYENFHTPNRIPVSELNNYRSTPFKIYLLPTTTLLIHFRNVNPYSAQDYFFLGPVDALNSDFSPRNTLLKNCGNPQIGQGGGFDNSFIGENGCGTIKYKTVANSNNKVTWVVKKNNVRTEENATIYCPEGKVTEFTINY